MEGTNRVLRAHILGSVALTAVGLFLGTTDAVAQLPPAYARCANTMGIVEEAIAACTALIQSGREYGRNLAISYSNRGISWARKGELDRAIADFTQAVRVDPNYARAYNARGSAYGKKNEFDRALADFNRAIELDPNFAPAFNNRGFTFAKKGDFDRAIADANTAIRLNANYARAYGTRGSVYAQKGELDRALADFNDAIRLDPGLAPAYNGRGLVHRKRGDGGRASADFTEAIRLDPTLAAAHNNRALLRKDQRDLAGAIADLDQAIRINPSYAMAYQNRGFVYERTGARARALADFNAALAIDPKLMEALAGRSRTSAFSSASRLPEPDRPRGAAPSPATVGTPEALSAKPAALPITTPAPQQKAPAPETTGATPTAKAAVPARTFTEVLAACTKAAEGAPQLSIAAYAGNGKAAIPACYKGRRHLECTVKALLEEAAAIDREYGEIVRENYPDRKDVKAICSIPADRLEEHLARAKTFDERSTKVQQVFQSNASCIESVRVAMGEINLGPMRDPGALMTSLLEHVGEPVVQASARQREVMRLVGQIDASQKAMATVQGLRRIVCP